jgi:hypothetical protein
MSKWRSAPGTRARPDLQQGDPNKIIEKCAPAVQINFFSNCGCDDPVFFMVAKLGKLRVRYWGAKGETGHLGRLFCLKWK